MPNNTARKIFNIQEGEQNLKVYDPAVTRGDLIKYDEELTIGGGGTVNSVTATAPLTSSGGVNPNLAMPAATAVVDGYLTAADWLTFNGKQGALTLTTVGSSGPATLVGNTLNIPNYAGATYTFSTGLTEAAGTVTANLSTGVSGGQTAVGGTAASNNLTLSSTTNATKGKILFGTSAYDEVNNRFGIGTASPSQRFSIESTTGGVALASFKATGTPTPVLLIEDGDVTIPNYTGGGFVIAPTSNTCGYLTSSSASTGGFSFQGFTSNNNTGNPLIFVGNHGGTSPTTPAVWFLGRKHNGTTAFNPLVNSQIIAGFNPGSGNDVMQILANANVLINTITDAGFRLDVNGTGRFQERLTVSQDNTVATQVVSVINTDTANCGMVIAPSGTGAIMADTPDGTATGGNARGTNAVDLQISRTVNTEVASGNNSFIGGGDRNTASNTGSVVVGGLSNTASQTYSFVGSGFNNVASGVRSVVSGGGGSGVGNTASGPVSTISGGANNTASADLTSISGGYGARAYLYGQRANASVEFAAASDAQTSAITLRRSITGVAAQELFLDGASVQAILNISSPGPTNARMWNVRVDLIAIVATVGAGTVSLNDTFSGNYIAAIKRVGSTTSMVGSVVTASEIFDTSMTTSVVTIDADDTTEALRIRFTPPTTAAIDTNIRVVATAYLTEVGR